MSRPEVWARAQLVEGRPTFSPPRLLFGVDIPKTLALKKAVYRDDLIDLGPILERRRSVGTFDCIISQQIAEAFHKQEWAMRCASDGVDLKDRGIYRCGTLLLDIAIVMDHQLPSARSRSLRIALSLRFTLSLMEPFPTTS